jgi:hypothetical protein
MVTFATFSTRILAAGAYIFDTNQHLCPNTSISTGEKLYCISGRLKYLCNMADVVGPILDACWVEECELWKACEGQESEDSNRAIQS